MLNAGNWKRPQISYILLERGSGRPAICISEQITPIHELKGLVCKIAPMGLAGHEEAL